MSFVKRLLGGLFGLAAIVVLQFWYFWRSLTKRPISNPTSTSTSNLTGKMQKTGSQISPSSSLTSLSSTSLNSLTLESKELTAGSGRAMLIGIVFVVAILFYFPLWLTITFSVCAIASIYFPENQSLPSSSFISLQDGIIFLFVSLSLSL